MEAFQLRLWDGRIGRWLSPDPYGQYASPYLGMGNNPISGIDPDGGFFQELGNWLSGNGWNSNAALAYQANGGTLGEWVGNKFTGYRKGSKDYDDSFATNGCGVEITKFKAVQDIPRFSFFKFEGELIIGTDFFDQQSSFTPGAFIIASRKTNEFRKIDFTKDYVKDHFHHEIGHIEQYRDLGVLYYPVIAIPSAGEYLIYQDDNHHNNFYTEKWANTLSIHRFGEFHNPKEYPRYGKVYFPLYRAFQKNK